LQVLFTLGNQPFHFAEQMGNALLVVERWEGDFDSINIITIESWDSSRPIKIS